jgi:hypothetical protein
MKPEVLYTSTPKGAYRGLLTEISGEHALVCRRSLFKEKELLKGVIKIYKTFLYISKFKQGVLEKINGVLARHKMETAYKISKERTQLKKMSLFHCETGQQGKVFCCAI